MKIAVTTPTGHIGKGIVQELLNQKNDQLVLLARDADKLITAQRAGAQVIEGDLANQSYYVTATKGIDVLFHLAPPNPASQDIRSDYQRFATNAAAAIKANNIQRVVHLSSIGADQTKNTGPILGLHDAEEILNKIEVSITHLRAGLFLENFMGVIPTVQQMSSIYLPVAGAATTPMVATKDISQVAATVLSDPKWKGQRVIYVMGAADYSFDDVAAEISKAIGKQVKHIKVSNEQALKALTGMGLSENFAKNIIELYNGFELGVVKPTQLRTKENTTPTTLAQFVKLVLAPAIKSAPPVTASH